MSTSPDDGGERPRVLVVDDDREIRRALKRVLQEDYEVVGAEDGETALELMEDPGKRPHIVLLDVRMPGIDGYEVSRRMQAREDLAWIPVTFLTVLEGEEDRRRAFAAGASAYLRKPFDQQELLDTIRKQVGTGERWRSLRQQPARQRSWLLPSTFVAFRRHLLDERRVSDEQRAHAEKVVPGRLYDLATIVRVPEEQVSRYLARFLDLPFVDRVHADDLALDALPRTFCESNLVVVLTSGRVVVSNPFDWGLMDTLEHTLWRDAPPDLALTGPDRIRHLCETEVAEIETVLGAARVLALETFQDEGGGAGDPDIATAQALAGEILRDAIEEGASDVHIEPKDRGALVRFRLDGDMHDIRTVDGVSAARIVSRLKAHASMDIAERRKPQDGAVDVRLGERRFKLRLATSSTRHGESLVIRILEPGQEPVPLQELGLSPDQSARLRELSDRHEGMILVVGPTGSGKSTTIYSLLCTVDGSSRSIMSVEDPVEYRIPYTNQQQVNERAGVTFEALLRSAMRQDPDILFLGEVRDPFSARAAMDFASSGHLTISTLHSSNSTTAVFRLERLGVQRSAMADALSGILAQKLLKRVCPECRQVGPPTPEEEAILLRFTDDVPPEVARPVGCPACRETGYQGRIGVCELLAFDPDVARWVREGLPVASIRASCSERGDYLMTDHALDKVRQLLLPVKDVYELVLVEETRFQGAPVSRPAEAGASEAPAEVPANASAEAPPAAGSTSKRPPASAGIDPDLAPALRSPVEQPSVLVVDDDEDLRALVELYLKQAGYQVTEAADGVDALLQLGVRAFDAVVSDVRMPNLDGAKLMEMIDQKGLDVPTIFLTGMDDEDLEVRLLELGAADYIRKPVRKEVLLMRLRNAVRDRPRSPSGGAS